MAGLLNYNITKTYTQSYGGQTPSDPGYEAANQALEEMQPYFQYLDDTQQQVLLGNYTDKSTLLGTVIQIGAGIAGVDAPADIRDITYDVQNFELSLEHLKQTGLDLAALAPVIGAVKNLKYGDEVAGAFKNVVKRADRLEEARTLISKGQKLSNEAKDALRGQARRILEAEGQDLTKKAVHHNIPLEWAHKMGKNFDPNALGNLKALDPATHAKINQEWSRFKNTFKRQNIEPSAKQIQNFTNYISQTYF